MKNLDTSKVSRVEVINHTRTLEEGGGRVYVYWDTKNQSDIEVSLQDTGRTMKIFISDKKESK